MPEHSSSDSAALPLFATLPDLASARLGGRAIATNDDFFAPKDNLVKAEAPIFVPGKYTSRGKWMDGWESRRRRTPGHDWCVVALGMRGVVRGLDVDTSFFTGNFPTHCAVDALDAPREPTLRALAAEGEPWAPLLPTCELRGDSHNWLSLSDARPWTHLRLKIYPDGGVARLRVYGEVSVDWRAMSPRALIDLAALTHGGRVLDVSDKHYGSPNNMLMPGRAANMGDGWETKRRRGPGHDWAIVKLGTAGVVRKVEIDTNHFKGNYPDSASLEGLAANGTWVELLPQTKLRPHYRHVFATQVRTAPAVTEVRLNIYPDGGISRLRVYGRIAVA